MNFVDEFVFGAVAVASLLSSSISLHFPLGYSDTYLLSFLPYYALTSFVYVYVTVRYFKNHYGKFSASYVAATILAHLVISAFYTVALVVTVCLLFGRSIVIDDVGQSNPVGKISGMSRAGTFSVNGKTYKYEAYADVDRRIRNSKRIEGKKIGDIVVLTP